MGSASARKGCRSPAHPSTVAHRRLAALPAPVHGPVIAVVPRRRGLEARVMRAAVRDLEPQRRALLKSTSCRCPPCTPTISAAIASPSPVPPLRCEPVNASNRWSRAFCGTPGPLSRTSTSTRRAFTPRLDADLAVRNVTGSSVLALALQRFKRVAHEVAQDAEQVVAVGIDAQRVADVEHPVDAALARQSERVSDLLGERLQEQRSRRGAASSARP